MAELMPEKLLDMSLDEVIKQKSSARKANSNARRNKATRREESAPYSSELTGKRGGTGGGLGGDNKRVYVGNLAYECTWKELKDFCSQAGRVARADVAEYEDSGRSKGWGIVEFSSANVAQRAISMLNDQELLGRPVHMREDREAPGPPPRRQQQSNIGSGGKVRHGGNGLNNNFGSRRIFVGNLAYPVGWPLLKDTFRECGEVVYADVMKGPDGRSKGCGIVEFSTPEEAALAIRTLNDQEIRGRRIFCREDREDKEMMDSRS